MSEIKYAGFGIRFLASLLDTFFLALPVGIVIYFISGGEWFDFSQYQQNLQMAMAGNANALNSQPQTSFTWELIFEISVLVITVLFWKQFKGATPGKKIVNIKIVDAKTLEDISNKQAITRSLGYIPSTLLLGLGFLMIIFTKNKQSLHDMLANTVVIYT
ncbi:RDD family protein [Sulfurimonas marina]|uniref:RDD family protein n=1 Tax=Sulfurimonas marina TaxID=2590551 RepID=A0A7M1AUC3_9BACT|nr:RDD family protein [Sulfurimonas marina]QOP41010.1 RDD family protein [Sulfurimonas marina]